MSLEAIWSDESLRRSGPSPAAARFSVSLPVLPCAVQETNACLLVGLQCFDLHVQMEPEVLRHTEKTKGNFCNLQERCKKNNRNVFLYAGCFFFFLFLWQRHDLNQTKIFKTPAENKDCRYLFKIYYTFLKNLFDI